MNPPFPPSSPVGSTFDAACREYELLLDKVCGAFDSVRSQLRIEVSPELRSVRKYEQQIERILAGYEWGVEWIERLFRGTSDRLVDFLLDARTILEAQRAAFQAAFRRAVTVLPDPPPTDPDEIRAEEFRATHEVCSVNGAAVAGAIRELFKGEAQQLASQTIDRLRSVLQAFDEWRAEPTGRTRPTTDLLPRLREETR